MTYLHNKTSHLAVMSSKSSLFVLTMARTRLRHSVPPHTRISTIKQQSRPHPAMLIFSEKRYFSKSNQLCYPRKDSQDRESMNTDATEYSKSATDDEAARHDDASFNPKLTNPEAQKTKASENNQVSVRIFSLPSAWKKRHRQLFKR